MNKYRKLTDSDFTKINKLILVNHATNERLLSLYSPTLALEELNSHPEEKGKWVIETLYDQPDFAERCAAIPCFKSMNALKDALNDMLCENGEYEVIIIDRKLDAAALHVDESIAYCELGVKIRTVMLSRTGMAMSSSANVFIDGEIEGVYISDSKVAYHTPTENVALLHKYATPNSGHFATFPYDVDVKTRLHELALELGLGLSSTHHDFKDEHFDLQLTGDLAQSAKVVNLILNAKRHLRTVRNAVVGTRNKDAHLAIIDELNARKWNHDDLSTATDYSVDYLNQILSDSRNLTKEHIDRIFEALDINLAD